MSTLTASKPKAALRQTRLLINNQWVDAAEGGRLEAINPTTGETIQIAASRKIAFRPAKELKETVQV